MDDPFPADEEGIRGLQGLVKRDEPDRHQECASQSDLTILWTKERQCRPTDEENHAD